LAPEMLDMNLHLLLDPMPRLCFLWLATLASL
jgi:hypothetical protein